MFNSDVLMGFNTYFDCPSRPNQTLTIEARVPSPTEYFLYDERSRTLRAFSQLASRRTTVKRHVTS